MLNLRPELEGITGWCKRRENSLALSLAVLVLVIHLASLWRVEERIYDEIYYAGGAQLILFEYGREVPDFYWDELESSNYDTVEEYREGFYYQHPPLGMLCIAAGIGMLGDGPFGWRVFPVLFGVTSLILFYLICRELTSRRWLPLLATFIFAFENLSFVMSGLAMLDVFSLTFMLASFLFYLRHRYVSSGIMLALSALAKLTGAFGGGIILLHWLLTRRTDRRDALRFIIVAPVAFLMMLPLLDAIAIREMICPWDRIDFWYNFHYNLNFSDYPSDLFYPLGVSRPWEWLLSTKSALVWPEPSYRTSPSWSLWVLIIPSMLCMLYQVIRRRHVFSSFSLSWFVVIIFAWMAIYWIWDRLMYEFYLYPAVGAVCLALGYCLSQVMRIAAGQRDIRLRWIISAPVVMWLVAHLVIFWLMAPVI